MVASSAKQTQIDHATWRLGIAAYGLPMFQIGMGVTFQGLGCLTIVSLNPSNGTRRGGIRGNKK